uniref:Uncharacterized protein n=1 Tax=Lygus hesperus TaxID=30085 RepID=A0A146MAC0_LYGHE
MYRRFCSVGTSAVFRVCDALCKPTAIAHRDVETAWQLQLVAFAGSVVGVLLIATTYAAGSLSKDLMHRYINPYVASTLLYMVLCDIFPRALGSTADSLATARSRGYLTFVYQVVALAAGVALAAVPHSHIHSHN